jgi:hypothetical protein
MVKPQVLLKCWISFLARSQKLNIELQNRPTPKLLSFSGNTLSYGPPWATTSVGIRTDYSVGPCDYPACATWHLMAWSTRTTEKKYSVRKLYMSRTIWETPRHTRLVRSPYSDLKPCLPDYIRRGRDPSLHHLISCRTITPYCNRTQSIQSYTSYRT